MPAPIEGGSVTVLRALDARGARFELEIGGERRVVSSELIGDFRIAVGRVVDASSAPLLSDGIRRLAVFDLAVAILARRPRSSRDLRLRLLRAGATDADVGAALERLQALGLQD